MFSDPPKVSAVPDPWAGPSQPGNIAATLRWAAARFPGQVAVAQPDGSFQRRPLRYRTITFAELHARACSIASGLIGMGVRPGQRISLMVPPGIEFVAWVWGLMRSGAVTILIDPGMGRSNMIRCLAEAEPAGLVGVWQAQAARTVFRRRLPHCRLNVVVGGGPGFGARRLALPPECSPDPPATTAEDAAAIIFTTGSTGPPKGVLYRHRHFLEQTRQIRDWFGIDPGGVDVSGFPLFALFNAGMGTTTVFPRMDATRPARIDPLDFADAVQHFNANQSFGSPALWNTVATWAGQHGLQLPSLKRILTAGAPVPAAVLRRVRAMIHPEGTVHTPYGATEALPVACIESREVLGEPPLPPGQPEGGRSPQPEDRAVDSPCGGTAALTAAGRGTCVGRRWPQIDWRIIQISDDPIADITGTTPMPRGEIGELIVSGTTVTDRYVTRTEANALHKISDGDRFWHRMGDTGYLDGEDRFWFCGRKSHRVCTPTGTMYTIPCEAIINQHPAIYRSALVGIGPRGQQRPVIVAEPLPGHWPRGSMARRKLIEELAALGAASPLTAGVRDYLLLRSLPVDIRHNSKIFREKIAVWAGRKLPGK